MTHTRIPSSAAGKHWPEAQVQRRSDQFNRLWTTTFIAVFARFVAAWCASWYQRHVVTRKIVEAVILDSAIVSTTRCNVLLLPLSSSEVFARLAGLLLRLPFVCDLLCLNKTTLSDAAWAKQWSWHPCAPSVCRKCQRRTNKRYLQASLRIGLSSLHSGE